MLELETQLRRWLEGSERVSILGIGNMLRSDDAIGVVLVQLMQRKLLDGVNLLNCETVPENFIGQVEAFQPTHVLLIDAAEFGGAPGDARLFSPESVVGITLSTHAISLSLLARIIEDRTKAKVRILGVQPKLLEFGETLSPELKEASKGISKALIRMLRELFP